MNRRNKILIIDDTHTNIEILLALLGDDYDVMVALEGDDGIELAIEENPDLILLDIVMPNKDGYEVCQILKADPKTAHIPVIFITAKLDEDSIEKAYDVGGIDYVTKPFKPKELLARVHTQLQLIKNIRRLEYISSHDELTGIFNRRKFFEDAAKEFTEGTKNLYAVMIDIDRFKNINDNYGHPTGDEAIKLVSNTIEKHLGNNDIFGRLGGEEFGILFHASSEDKVKIEVDALRNIVESKVITAPNGDPIKMTISQGVSKLNENIHSLEQLIKIADVALYEAKAKGRNRTIFKI